MFTVSGTVMVLPARSLVGCWETADALELPFETSELLPSCCEQAASDRARTAAVRAARMRLYMLDYTPFSLSSAAENSSKKTALCFLA